MQIFASLVGIYEFQKYDKDIIRTKRFFVNLVCSTTRIQVVKKEDL